MNLALNNLQRLICHKTQPTNQPTKSPTKVDMPLRSKETQLKLGHAPLNQWFPTFFYLWPPLLHFLLWWSPIAIRCLKNSIAFLQSSIEIFCVL